VAGRHDLCVYASRHADEENLCVEVQGVVVADTVAFLFIE
jgi:hypothetical protein